MIAFLFAVVAVDRISAQVTFPGPCPENVQSVETFDVERYLGIWYEYAKYPAAFEGPGSCIVAKYSLNEEGNLNVVNGMINNR